MQLLTANTAQKNLNEVINSVLLYEDTASIVTDNGTVMLVNKEDWDGMAETLYLYSIPGMVESILEGLAEPIEDCLDSVGWDINSAVADNGTMLVKKEDWDGMAETLYLYSIPGMVESILEAYAEPEENCISLEELLAD